MPALDDDRLPPRLRGVTDWLEASPSEAVGLVVLLLGAVAATALLWWTARPQPVAGAATAAPASTASPFAALTPTAAATPSGSATVTVHVAGAVATPGVIALPAGARVADAVVAAGGTALDADVAALNLARAVSDGEQVVVPRLGETPAAPAAPAGTTTAGSSAAMLADGRVDLNRATVADLDQLPGIGPVLAQRIVDYRDSHGGFTDVAQLQDVSGIGDKRFEELSQLVAVP